MSTQTENINEILGVADEARDFSWELRFLDALPSTQVKILDDKPIQGPDGMPYLMVSTDAAEEGDDIHEPQPVPQVVEWLCENGIGLVVNPQKQVPDYVLTFGMLWSWRHQGSFLKKSDDTNTFTQASGAVKFTPGEQVLIGPPSDEYLPPYVRGILRQFFEGLGLKTVKVAMIAKPNKPYDFCFSLESLGNPPAMEHKNVLEGLSWFFPQHYPLLLVSEKGLPSFFDL